MPCVCACQWCKIFTFLQISPTLAPVTIPSTLHHPPIFFYQQLQQPTRSHMTPIIINCCDQPRHICVLAPSIPLPLLCHHYYRCHSHLMTATTTIIDTYWRVRPAIVFRRVPNYSNHILHISIFFFGPLRATTCLAKPLSSILILRTETALNLIGFWNEPGPLGTLLNTLFSLRFPSAVAATPFPPINRSNLYNFSLLLQLLANPSFHTGQNWMGDVQTQSHTWYNCLTIPDVLWVNWNIIIGMLRRNVSDREWQWWA